MTPVKLSAYHLPIFGLVAVLGAWVFSPGAPARPTEAETQSEGAAARQPAVPDPNAPLLVVNGETVTRAEIEAAAEKNLRSVEMQALQCQAQASQNRHKALEIAIEEVTLERLIQAAAAKQSQGAEEWKAAELARREQAVTEPQIDEWFTANQNRLRGRTKEQVADQIRTLLSTEGFNADLKAQGEVKSLLEPYRIEVESEGFPTKGPVTAPVTILEFSDFECPFCQRVNPTLARVTEEYGDRVRVVFRQYPLDSIHASARKAAEASLCADDQGKFWAMHDLLFAEQKELGVEQLKEKAGRLGLDAQAFNLCLDTSRHAERVEADLRAGILAGVSGTPAIFVNGRPLSGAVPFEQLAELIDAELKRLGSTGQP